MMGELDLLGVFVPGLLLWALLALLLLAGLRRVLARFGLADIAWHPPLFDAAAYLILLGLVVGLAHLLVGP